MSNIDKQALLVSKAKASVFTMEYISQFEASDIDSDDVDLRFEVDGTETGTIVSIVDECGHAAQIITALLDEVEHYKSREERVTKLVLDNSTSWDALYEKLEAAERRIANNERVMRAVVEAASIRGIRPFEGIECDPPTLEENAEACGDAMSARIRELEANPPKPHHNGLMQISNELVQARQRIAELEKGHQEAAKQINSWRRLAKQNIAERGKDISELEAARQRIAELENSETQLINERDAAESALADMYQAATGERPEWSNMFGFADAVDVVEERLATLEANQSQTTPTGIQLITEAIGAHGYIVGCLLQGRPDLALEESRKWVSAFGQAAEIVSAQDAAGIKVKGE
ncbi:ead/Ea22-like family protein [Salmonella enterica]|nr:ead/Ea22-like family protein [Salmonella enterica]ECY2328425.1 ead/Ea22-like family protein [Salmonella enterica]